MMAGTLNKRQQARNERALQDLIKTVPGNNTCADCGAKNPGELFDTRWKHGYADLVGRRMGKLECECQNPTVTLGLTLYILTLSRAAVRDLLMHALRRTPPKARHACFEGQIVEHG